MRSCSPRGWTPSGSSPAGPSGSIWTARRITSPNRPSSAEWPAIWASSTTSSRATGGGGAMTSKGLTKFAKDRGVGVWLWRGSKELRDAKARRELFQRCRAVGAVGVKLDFFDHEAKEMIDFYQTLLKETAENHLMVNFHGANKPTGEQRTWPNELTREAVRGMESSAMRERARHGTTLPFTRLLAGPADYTPVHFGTRRGDTTWAHH